VLVAIYGRCRMCRTEIHTVVGRHSPTAKASRHPAGLDRTLLKYRWPISDAFEHQHVLRCILGRLETCSRYVMAAACWLVGTAACGTVKHPFIPASWSWPWPRPAKFSRQQPGSSGFQRLLSIDSDIRKGTLLQRDYHILSLGSPSVGKLLM